MIDQNTKEIADKVIDLAKAGLVEVYGKIQQVAPELWKLVVRQVKIDGIECFIGAFIGAVLLFYSVFAFQQMRKRNDDAAEGFAISGIVSFLVGIILFPTFLINGLDFFLNPEWWALKDILSLIRH